VCGDSEPSPRLKIAFLVCNMSAALGPYWLVRLVKNAKGNGRKIQDALMRREESDIAEKKISL
jgi:hypothetical protein